MPEALNPVPMEVPAPPRIPRRPLPGIALVFIAGMAAGFALGPPRLPVLAAAGAAWLAAALCARRGAAGLLAWTALALAGLATAVTTPPPLSARISAPDGARNIILKIRLRGDPVRYLTSSGRDAWEAPAGALARYDTATDTWHDERGALTAAWHAYERLPPPRYGDIWRIEGRFYGPVRAGRFWAHRTRRLATGAGWNWVAQCFEWRRRAAAALETGIGRHPRRIAVVKALLLGLRRELPADIHARFASTGTLHVVAISGLHVGVMTALFVFALRCAGISREHWFFFLAPLTAAYTLATGARTSAVRACIMALAYWSALPVRRRPDTPSALALAALTILIVDPRQLQTPGFLFSFTIVAGLLGLFQPLHECLTAGLRQSGDRPQTPPGTGYTRRVIITVSKWFAGLAIVSAIAWYLAAPLSALFFGRISLVALPANLLVVPLAFLIVVTGCLSLAGGAAIPALGAMYNHANLVWSGALLKLLEWMSAWPGAGLELRIPGWILPVWYAFPVWLAWRLRRKECRN